LTAGNRDVEYQQTMSYIQHMYDTRHQIFQFVKVDSGRLALARPTTPGA
jgi:hypothetical protein